MKTRSLSARPAIRTRRRSAFTLIEILVVVVIIAILAAVVVPNVISRIGDAKSSAAISDLKTFDDAIDAYKLDTGNNPASLDVLVTNPGDPKWKGPYLKNQTSTPMDPWGHPYLYKSPGDNGREYDISSAGDGAHPINGWDVKGTGAK